MGAAPEPDRKPETPRRPASFEELRALNDLWRGVPRVRTWVSCLVASCIGAIVGSAALQSGASPTAVGLTYGGFGVAAVFFAAFLAVVVRRVLRGSRVRAILRDADPALAPAAPLTEGDRLGGWVALESSSERLHVARAQSLAFFRLARAGALLAALGVAGSTLAFVVAKLWSGAFKGPGIRMIIGAVAGVSWLGRFALARTAYQWTVDDDALVLQDAALFGPSRLSTITAPRVKGFEADARELRVKLDDGTTRPLAGLGGTGSPLAGWRASSVATTIAVLMDLRTELTFVDDRKRTTVVAIPAEFADAADLSPSTAAMLQAEDEPRAG